jgi:uridylate kinase
MCHENKIDLIVFNMEQEGNIKRAILGEKIGTIVK